MSRRYIAFLRAVNVGGRVVTMERLRELFGELGLSAVRTYIQSGNVFFETARTDRAKLTRQIEQHLSDALRFEVPAFVRTIDEIESALVLDPFRSVRVTPDTRLCVVLISAPLPADLRWPMTSPGGDSELLAATPGEVFAVLHQTPGRASNPAAFIEKTFKVNATSRFFATMQKIAAAARL